jgi:hypothetical protein
MMSKEQALQVVIEALNVAIKNGCYGLLETKNIVGALDVLTTPSENSLEIVSEG